MATRLNESAKARKSLPLTERDLADLERLREASPERRHSLILLVSSTSRA